MNIAKLKRRKRLSVLFLAFIAITISGFLILSASRDSLIYFYSPTELMEIKNIDNKTIRIGGLVKEESIISKDKSKIEFIVEDGKNYLYVHYEGILPDLFMSQSISDPWSILLLFNSSFWTMLISINWKLISNQELPILIHKY